MKTKFKIVPGSIVDPQGFLAPVFSATSNGLARAKGSHKGKKRGPRPHYHGNSSDGPPSVHHQPGLRRAVKVCIERVSKASRKPSLCNSGKATPAQAPRAA